MLAPACRELCFPPRRVMSAVDRELIEEREHGLMPGPKRRYFQGE